jgi:glutaminyl-peptide cyclotransferase
MAWSRRTTLVSGVLVSSVIAFVAGWVLLTMANIDPPANALAPRGRELTLADIPFNGERAYEHLRAICAIGPRISGSEGMARQQEMVTEHFESLKAKVTPQEFFVRHPETGERTRLANLIIEFHPERKERILFCAHYDTRPFPDEDPDPRKRRNPFLGANDGASGVALLMEFGTHMADYQGKYGVDFVLFDAEELIYDRQRDKYFLGSEYFASDYVARPPAHTYRCGVLLDMVADKELHLFMEKNSALLRDVRPVTEGLWATAKRLGVKEFVPRVGHDIRDDHLPLNQIARIPTCDIIDFDYPRPGPISYWHTTHDVPENCSALSLAKVGWVVHEWLRALK